MNENDLISIIIPIYNSESFINDCLYSLKNQTYSNIEVIMVDDGSTDNSGSIIDEWGKDTRFKAVHQKNSGVSVARNRGVTESNGKWIMFVDSDDIVDPKFCSKALQSIQTYNSEICMFKFDYFVKNKIVPVHNKIHYSDGKISMNEAMDLLMSKAIGCYSWNKIYLKTLFNNISYPPGKVYEDIYTTYKIVLKAKKISFLNDTLYHYRINEHGIVESSKYNEKNLADCLAAQYEQYRCLNNYGFNNSASKCLVYLIEDAITYCIYYNKHNLKYKFAKKILLNTKKVKLKGMPIKRKIMVKLFQLNENWFNIVCDNMGKRK